MNILIEMNIGKNGTNNTIDIKSSASVARAFRRWHSNSGSILFLLVTLIFILPDLSIAQTTRTISWGPEYKSNSAKGKYYKRKEFFGATDKHYYIHVFEDTWKSKELLLKYNYDNVLLEEIDLDVKRNRRSIKRFEMVQTSAGDYVVGICANKKKRIYDHYYYELNKSSPKDFKLLFSTPMYKFRDAKGFIEIDDYAGVVVSPDSNYVVFTNAIGSSQKQKKNVQELVKLNVFNKEMELQWQKIVRFPVDNQKFYIIDVSISNEGILKLLAKKELKKPKEKKLPFSSKYETYLYRITKETDSEPIRVESKIGYIFNPKLVTVGENDFIFGTYHLPKARPNEEQGFFLNKYNSNGKKEFAKNYPWNEDVTESEKIKGYAYTENIFVQDSSLTFITQQKFGGQPSFSSKWYYGDWNYKMNNIIIPSISFDGKLKWIKSIERHYVGKVATGKKVKSLISLLKKDEIYLVFDQSMSIKAIQINGVQTTSGFTESHLTQLIGINSKGEIEVNQPIHKTKQNSKFNIYSEDAHALTNGRILFRKNYNGISNTNYSYGILKLIKN